MHRSSLAVFAVAALPSLSACKSDLCGNGKIDADEACDGAALADASCAASGFSYGEIGCTTGCELDTAGCVTDPCWYYPCEPRGTDLGSVIEDMTFEPGPDLGASLAGIDGMFSFDDLYARNPAHGGTLKGLLLFVSSGWCPYCADEANELEALYQEYAGQGIMIVGMTIEDAAGNVADAADAQAYGERHGWSFPAVPGSLSLDYWATEDIRGSVPLHLFVDLNSMRLSSRIEGAATTKLLRLAFDELAAGVPWAEDGTRPVSFDCAPGAGSEVEPNGLGQIPAVAGTLPYTLTGTICPPIIAESLQVDEDLVDLGDLAAGTVIDVRMESQSASKNYPLFVVIGVDEANASTWMQYSPVRMDGSVSARHVAVPEAGHYLVAAEDGRLVSWMYYGADTIPAANDCCEGGADYTYSLVVSPFTLAATEAAVAVGASLAESASENTLKVYPLSAIGGTTYAIAMTADSPAELDPMILLYDAATGAVLAFNDDADYENGDYDGRISWTATADATLWIVASYVSAVFNGGAPAYHLTVN